MKPTLSISAFTRPGLYDLYLAELEEAAHLRGQAEARNAALQDDLNKLQDQARLTLAAAALSGLSASFNHQPMQLASRAVQLADLTLQELECRT